MDGVVSGWLNDRRRLAAEINAIPPALTREPRSSGLLLLDLNRPSPTIASIARWWFWLEPALQRFRRIRTRFSTSAIVCAVTVP